MTVPGALVITDLDDFLTPSQACIIPVRNGKTQSDLPSGETEIHIDDANNYYEVSTYATTATAQANSIAGPGPSTLRNEKKALEKAEINLNDCLACSGCITSTESLLITLQSQTEVLSYISACTSSPPTDTRTPVLSISPQTLASLSAAYAAKRSCAPIPLVVLLRRIRHFLSAPERGGWRVWDTTSSRHLSLKETVREFEERKAAIGAGVGHGDAGASRANGMDRDVINGHKVNGEAAVPKPGPLPMLASACPGWVCYAEKAQADLLPLLSAVRSSQAISGALVKQWWAGRMGISPEQVYHVSAMPCYDKKLEASRSDFYSELHQTRDIDCVLTTGELDLLLSELGFNPYTPPPLDKPDNVPLAGPSTLSHTTDIASRTTSPLPELIQHPGTVSGSYLHTLLHHFSTTHPSPTSIHIRKIRDSPDNEEYILYDSLTGEAIFKGAKVYGFRNLQNLVRKVGKETGLGKGKGAGKLAAAVAARRRKAKTGQGEVQTPGTPGTPGLTGAAATGAAGGVDVGDQLEWMRKWDEKKLDFVEVMACPSGCVNGGGQMKPVGPNGLDDSSAGSSEGVEKPCNGSNAASSAFVPPPSTVELDAEGYPRPLPDEGTSLPLPKLPINGSSATPTNGAGQGAGAGAGEESEEGWRWSTKEWVKRVEDVYWLHTGISTDQVEMQRRAEEADEMCERVVHDVAHGDEGVRWEFLRTRFRKVEGDVLSGGGVTLDAVKW